MRYRRMLPLINGALLVLVAAVFLSSHGGLKGDSNLPWLDDSVSEPENIGPILFNHWRIDTHRESVLVRGFVWINVAAFYLSDLIIEPMTRISRQFRTMYPYGISFATYNVLLGLSLSFLQWYLVGILIDKMRKKGGNSPMSPNAVLNSIYVL